VLTDAARRSWAAAAATRAARAIVFSNAFQPRFDDRIDRRGRDQGAMVFVRAVMTL